MKQKQDDLASMSLDELWTLHVNVKSVLAARMMEEKQQLESRLAQLKQGGGSQHKDAATRKPYPTVLPKFRNPRDRSETWAGRGKTPKWLSTLLQSGKQIDDFRIDEVELEATH